MEAVNPKDIAARGKVPLSIVPPAALIEIARALQFGAVKYGRANWRTLEPIASNYVDATMRHLAAWMDGEERAKDSNVHHLAHAAASLCILIDAMNCGTLQDDRPSLGPAAAMLEAKWSSD
jgi:hypothetical protein